jgi:hypothetical protein
VLSNSPEYPAYALRNGRTLELLRDVAHYVRQRHRLPRTGLRSAIRPKSRIGVIPPMPSWLKPEYVARMDLAARWRQIFSRPFPHPWRPHAYDALSANPWRHCMEEFAPDVTGAPLECRHPFLDLRLIRYALRLPAFPYCLDKRILRSAFADQLPEAALSRPKTPMLDDPLCASLRRGPILMPSSAIHGYVDLNGLRASFEVLTPGTWVNIRPLVLDSFLGSLQIDKRRKTA